jgi:acetoin utilization deacetylase AcuC-like enzyme
VLDSTLRICEGFAYCVQHVAPPNHDEDPERYAAAQRGFERSKPAPSAERIDTRAATLDELARVHTPRFIEQVSEIESRRSSN